MLCKLSPANICQGEIASRSIDASRDAKGFDNNLEHHSECHIMSMNLHGFGGCYFTSSKYVHSQIRIRLSTVGALSAKLTGMTMFPDHDQLDQS